MLNLSLLVDYVLLIINFFTENKFVFSFIADAWGPCSVTCGDGVKTRVVTCKIYLDFSRTYATLPDEKCQGSKPMDKERCVEAPCALSNR